MKRRDFLNFVLLALCIMGVITSCQNENDEGDSKATANRYLAVQAGYLDNLSFMENDSNTVNFLDAFNRVVGISKRKTYAKIPSAAAANMSAELYNYLSDNFIEFKRIKTRTGGDNPSLSENENDCLTCTMAEVYAQLMGIADYKTKKEIYKSIWDLMVRTKNDHGVSWGFDGYQCEKLLKACFDNVERLRDVKHYSVAENHNPYNTRCIGIIETGIETYHAVRIIYLDEGNDMVIFYDDQKGGVTGTTTYDKFKGAFEVSQPSEPDFILNYQIKN